MFITTATAMYSLGHGLRTLPAVPRSTQPSTLWDGKMSISFRDCRRLLLLIIFYTLGIKDPEGFGQKINVSNCRSDHYSGQSSRTNES